MLIEIWTSLRSLPTWVQVWVVLILIPVNFLSMAFLHAPYGGWVAGLAIGGMALNLPIILYDRGMSKLMSVPHVLLWTPLWVLSVVLLLTTAEGDFRLFLWLLTAINTVSLVFDYVDAVKWLRGDRAVAGRSL